MKCVTCTGPRAGRVTVARACLVLAAMAFGCSSDGAPAKASGTGGAFASGGAMSTGGSTATGGASASGGNAASGGAPTGGAGGSGSGGESGDAASGGTGAGGSTPDGGGSPGTGGAQVTPSGPVVTTTSGKVQGFVQGDTNEFLGIPYGAPPTGERRFASPAPAPAWNDVRAVTVPGPVCYRKKEVTTSFLTLPPQSEDCLNLNVYRPQATASKGPVIVFLPSNANGDYDAAALAEATGAVIVYVNYRAGALGYLVNKALDASLGVPSGNLGIRDQQLALTWVKDNIAQFGGDPDNVTLLGQSCVHAFAAGSRTLAKRFVMNSSSCVSNPTFALNRASVEWLSDKLVAKLCPGVADPVACLRGLAPEAIASFKYLDTTDPGSDPFGQAFMPQMDGLVIQDYPKHLLQTGEFHHGEVLAGANLFEARITRLDPEQTKQLKNSKIAFGFYGIFTYITQWTGIQSLYTPATDADSVDSFERVSTDTWFRCPIRAVARAAADKGSHVYLYSFELSPAAAGLELDYVFGQPVISPALKAPPYDPAAPVPLDQNLVSAVQKYIGNFAKSGDPNGGALPSWPPYSSTSSRHLVLDVAPKVGTAFSQKECDAWDSANAGSSF